ncbi:MAG: GNAT family N-acetyltransferase [Chloroflexi bacterium]|nr:GNAT family N-acetyltransferase [Chloroflexota bacterium]
MWWRLTRSQFEKQKGEGNRDAFHEIVRKEQQTGILAYHHGAAVGWCALAPRESYPALDRSRILRPVDDEHVWSITCFFVARPYRRQGLTVFLLQAAVKYARASGAAIVEGYPVEPREGKMPDAFVYTGLAGAFRRAGFVEVARRSETRPIMRYYG